MAGKKTMKDIIHNNSPNGGYWCTSLSKDKRFSKQKIAKIKEATKILEKSNGIDDVVINLIQNINTARHKITKKLRLGIENWWILNGT